MSRISVALTAEETSKFVQAGDVKIHYHEAGSRPTLVCIHGGAPGASGWGNFGRNLDALARNFRTIIVDLPGFGLSDKPEFEGGHYGFYSRTFRAMFETLRIEKAHVIGMATGGGASMQMCLDYPEVIGRQILVGSVGAFSLFSASPSEGQKIIGGYYGGEGASFENMRAYLQMMYDRSLITDELIQERYDASVDPAFMQTAPEGRERAPVNSYTEDLWKDMDRIGHKTLVIWGRDNRVQGYDNALMMLQRMQDVQVHIFGQCGLWVPYEKAAEFNELVTSFLKPDRDK